MVCPVFWVAFCHQVPYALDWEPKPDMLRRGKWRNKMGWTASSAES